MYPAEHNRQSSWGYGVNRTNSFAGMPNNNPAFAGMSGNNSSGVHPMQWPQPHQPPQPQPPTQRFPSSKQWRRDDKGGGKSEFFYSEAPGGKRQKLDSATNASPTHASPTHGSPPHGGAPYGLPAGQPPMTANPTPPPYIPHHYPMGPAVPGAVPTPSPAGWHQPFHSPVYPGVPTNPYGYAAPTPPVQHGYPGPAGYPYGQAYQPPPFAGGAQHMYSHSQLPTAPGPYDQYAAGYHPAYHPYSGPTPGWPTPPVENVPPRQGRGPPFNARPPDFQRSVSGPARANVWTAKSGTHSHISAKHATQHSQPTPPLSTSAHETPDENVTNSLEYDDNAWIDCEPDDYWPREEEMVPELGIGFVVWRPPQLIYRAMPGTYEESEQWSKDRARLTKRKTGDSVSKYLWESKIDEHCLLIAETDDWKEVRDDPIFVEFRHESRMIPINEVIKATTGRDLEEMAHEAALEQTTEDSPPHHPSGIAEHASHSPSQASEAMDQSQDSDADDDDNDEPYSPSGAGMLKISKRRPSQEFDTTASYIPLGSPAAKDASSEGTKSPRAVSPPTHDWPRKDGRSLSQSISPNEQRSPSSKGVEVTTTDHDTSSHRPVPESITTRLPSTEKPEPALSSDIQRRIDSITAKSRADASKPPQRVSSHYAQGSRRFSSGKHHADRNRAPPPPPPAEAKMSPRRLSKQDVDPSDPWSRGTHAAIGADSPRSEVSHNTVALSDPGDVEPRENGNQAEAAQPQQTSPTSADPPPSVPAQDSNGNGSIRKRPREFTDDLEEVKRQEDDTFGRHRKKGPKVNAVYSRRW